MTAASEQGQSLEVIMTLSGHRSHAVAGQYVRGSEAMRNPAARAVVDALDDQHVLGDDASSRGAS
jgi:hypothetical protein